MLSIAHGYDTYKLKFGQHGGNHPVANNGVVEITAQNHNYNVPDNIIEIADVTHLNLFDNTIEGVKYKNKEIFSVQHHPEASPGPHESKYIFQTICRYCKIRINSLFYRNFDIIILIYIYTKETLIY